MKRLTYYQAVSDTLAQLTDGELADLLANASRLHAGVGGRSMWLTIHDTPVFVKRIPLTDVERRPAHVQSTANLFEIPLPCHYGFGGPGFSAWRELSAASIANEWVLSGACGNFPLLYHWRVLPSLQRERLEGDVDFWIEWSAVRARLDAMHDATAHLVLFCEFLPQNLLDWLGRQLRAKEDEAASAIAFVDAHLAPTIDFMNARGLIHFDTHFENIMTDGERFCVGDFGLALSSNFELTDEEAEFMTRHGRYDHARAAVAYVHCLTAAFVGTNRWKEHLLAFLKGEGPSFPRVVASAIRRQAPLAVAFLEFLRRLREDKATPYALDF
jgi:hypothetical protein